MDKGDNNQKVLTQKIGFIGGGNMAKAICEGIVEKGLTSYENIYVSGPHLETLNWWTNNGCHAFKENGTVVKEADVIFICVKPHVLQFAIEGIKQTYPDDRNELPSKLYVSVLAGVKLGSLQKELQYLKARCIRVIPNTPITVGEGCALFTAGFGAGQTDIDLVKTIFSATGICKEVPESVMDAAGALTGSGPAFIYTVLEALADGAVKVGVPRSLATELAAQMTLGAAKMARDTGKHTGQLKDEVCSPGGTTIEGVHVLEKGAIRAAFIEAIEVTSKKAEQLGKK